MRHGFPVLTLALLALAGPVRAADYDKYLLDDTNFLVTLDVRQAVAAPLFAKHYQKQVDELLKMEQVQAELKKLGFDPLKDIDQIVLAMGLSSHRDEVQVQENNAFGRSAALPLVILQGRFDAAKFDSSLQKRVQDKTMKAHESNGAKYYEVIGQPGAMLVLGGFIAVVNKNTVVAAGNKDEIEDVLAKAAGKKKTQLKLPAMQKLLDQRDAKLVVEVLGCHEMVVDTSVESVNMVTKVTRKTLEDHGIESIRGGLAAGDDLKAFATVTCKQAARAKELNQLAEAGLKSAIDEAGKVEQLAGLVKAAKSVKIKLNDRSLEMNGQAEGNLLEMIFLFIFMK